MNSQVISQTAEIYMGNRCKRNPYTHLWKTVILNRCITIWMLYIREPNVGGIPFKHQGVSSRDNPFKTMGDKQGWLWYTANYYALPMCQANLLNIPL